MKPDYYIHQRTRTYTSTTRGKGKQPDTHEKVTKTAGEHVLSYRIWKTMNARDVATLIGPLAKDVK